MVSNKKKVEETLNWKQSLLCHNMKYLFGADLKAAFENSA